MEIYPETSIDINLGQKGGYTFHVKNLIIKEITKDQYDILNNTHGIELYDFHMAEFERLEQKR